jgi:hypothetical protein
MPNLDFFKSAYCLNETYKDILNKNKVRFRGNCNSLSFISTSNCKPQIGLSDVSNPNGILTNCTLNEKSDAINQRISELIQRIEDMEVPGRNTPEKELQSHIISYSMNNDYSLPFCKSLKFISDEFIPPTNENTHPRDILGYCEKTKQLCAIELKAARNETELINQVNAFESELREESNFKFVVELAEIHGFKIENSLKIKKIIVWPFDRTSPKAAFKNSEITEICFTKNNETGEYLFQSFDN